MRSATNHRFTVRVGTCSLSLYVCVKANICRNPYKLFNLSLYSRSAESEWLMVNVYCCFFFLVSLNQHVMYIYFFCFWQLKTPFGILLEIICDSLTKRITIYIIIKCSAIYMVSPFHMYGNFEGRFMRGKHING